MSEKKADEPAPRLRLMYSDMIEDLNRKLGSKGDVVVRKNRTDQNPAEDNKIEIMFIKNKGGSTEEK
ncbi:MAG: hypothetical protein P8M05_02160 [Flavobacteriales bacterium]|nr:hypothetical protein [Flavobacteriales bacterium]